jgi:hypothetical protein
MTDTTTHEIAYGDDRRPRLVRRLVEPALALVAAGLVLLVVHMDGGRTIPVAAPVAVPAPAAHTTWRVIAPRTAAPGERVPVVGFRDRRLCGPAQLWFDGVPATQQIVGYAGRLDADQSEVFMTMVVPRSATAGVHTIDLYGPRPGGTGPLCADVHEHQARLASTSSAVRA